MKTQIAATPPEVVEGPKPERVTGGSSSRAAAAPPRRTDGPSRIEVQHDWRRMKTTVKAVGRVAWVVAAGTVGLAGVALKAVLTRR